MRFFTTTVAIMAGLTATGTAFVIDTYSDDNCGDVVQEGVNIWDNSCATGADGFRSFKIKTWGGKRQKGYFFTAGGCGSLPDAIGKGYVDSSTHDYKLGECESHDGANVNAIASYSS